MLTVMEAAKKAGRDPETVRRWIRSGRLRSRKMGAQYLIDEADLAECLGTSPALELPKRWRRIFTGEKHPDWVEIVRRSRESH